MLMFYAAKIKADGSEEIVARSNDLEIVKNLAVYNAKRLQVEIVIFDEKEFKEQFRVSVTGELVEAASLI
jgi:hypothetical protein